MCTQELGTLHAYVIPSIQPRQDTGSYGIGGSQAFEGQESDMDFQDFMCRNLERQKFYKAALCRKTGQFC